MKKVFALINIIGLALWADLSCRAANLGDAFGVGGFLDKAGGTNGAGYNTSQRTVDPIIGNVILIMTSFLGVIFLVLMIYAGFTWMTALGEDTKVKKAKDMLAASIIGLIILIMAYMITYFVFIKVAQPALTV